METFKLVKPDVSHIEEIRQFRFDMLNANSGMAGTGPLERMPDIAEWLDFNRRMEKKENVPEDFVTAEQFIYVRELDQKIVGMIQLRHELTERLRMFGGHIGYSVRPDERKKGYAKQMLAACLGICKERGMTKVLITCREDNEASRRTILANGGVYEATVYNSPEDAHVERYWVVL